jgi:hypothetical protein
MPAGWVGADDCAMRALLVLAAAVFALAAPAAQSASPRALGILMTGYGIDVSPSSIGPEEYTVQVHNIGQYAVKVRLQGGFALVVPPNGWAFPVVHLRVGTHQIVARGRDGRWTASVSVNP